MVGAVKKDNEKRIIVNPRGGEWGNEGKTSACVYV